MTINESNNEKGSGEVLLPVAEVASRLGTSPAYVRRLIAGGKLKAIRLGPKSTRIAEAEVARFLAGGAA